MGLLANTSYVLRPTSHTPRPMPHFPMSYMSYMFLHDMTCTCTCPTFLQVTALLLGLLCSPGLAESCPAILTGALAQESRLNSTVHGRSTSGL